MNPLITAQDIDLNSMHILDVRYPGPGSPINGHAEYLEGHIPGAVYLDMADVLAGPHIPGVTGRHPLPEPSRLEAGLRAAGVRHDATLVVYDNWNSSAAARAWWLLRHVGVADVRVLDGGWSAWQASGREVEPGEVRPEWGDVSVDKEELSLLDADGAAAIAGSGGVLLDARPAHRFRGEDESVDPTAGHIPGAVSLPAGSLVAKDGTMKPANQLRQAFEQAGGADGVYCGSGISAAYVALAAAVAGVNEDLPLYAGSWSEWITDPTRPVATGQ